MPALTMDEVRAKWAVIHARKPVELHSQAVVPYTHDHHVCRDEYNVCSTRLPVRKRGDASWTVYDRDLVLIGRLWAADQQQALERARRWCSANGHDTLRIRVGRNHNG